VVGKKRDDEKKGATPEFLSWQVWRRWRGERSTIKVWGEGGGKKKEDRDGEKHEKEKGPIARGGGGPRRDEFLLYKRTGLKLLSIRSQQQQREILINMR